METWGSLRCRFYFSLQPAFPSTPPVHSAGLVSVGSTVPGPASVPACDLFPCLLVLVSTLFSGSSSGRALCALRPWWQLLIWSRKQGPGSQCQLRAKPSLPRASGDTRTFQCL